MLQRGFRLEDLGQAAAWEELQLGVPTIVALAQLCGRSLQNVEPARDPDRLPAEARALLAAAAQTGSFTIRGNKNAFQSAQRLLTVCVELDEGRRIEFRNPANAEQTVRFLEGFRQLCLSGLVMHQLMNEFSLTASGFELARKVDKQAVNSLLRVGIDNG